MASLSPFYEVDGDTDGGILAIVAITGSLLSLSTLILRFFVLRGLHTLRSYDYALLLAFALLLVQTALSMHAARLGVGKHRSSVGLDQIQSIEQVGEMRAILMEDDAYTHVFILIHAGPICHLASCNTRHRSYPSLYMPVCRSHQRLLEYPHGKRDTPWPQYSELCRRLLCNVVPLSAAHAMGSSVARYMLCCDIHLFLHDRK